MDDKTIREWASEPCCTVAEASKILNRSPQTVRRMIRRGLLIGWPPNPASSHLLLYRRQVEAMAVSEQRRAVKYACTMQRTFDFF